MLGFGFWEHFHAMEETEEVTLSAATITLEKITLRLNISWLDWLSQLVSENGPPTALHALTPKPLNLNPRR